MSEFIGSRISLISKSDIRYVGTLHNIDSENSSVALENVQCHGTEGRLGNPEDEIAPSSNIYEYIVFRGSDVKDLRIEEPPKESRPAPSELNDPAILGAGSRPQTSNDQPYQQNQRPAGNQPPPPQYPFAPPGPQQPSPFQPASDLPYPPYNRYQNQQSFGGYSHGPQGLHGPHPGFPGGPPNEFPNYLGGPYGPPPNWRPSPGPPNQHSGMEPMYQHSSAMNNAPRNQQIHSTPPDLPAQSVEKPAKTEHGEPPTVPKVGSDQVDTVPPQPPPPPLATKPDMSTETAGGPVAPPSQQRRTAAQNGARGRIVPAVPFIAPTNRAFPKPVQTVEPSTTNDKADGNGANQGQAASDAARQYQHAAQAATAAVAAAMAKLPPASGQKVKPHQANNDQVDNLTKKVNEMRTNENNRISRGRGAGSSAQSGRGRGGRRGGRDQGRGLEVPKTDFDFESANAKFNKQDLANEAIAAGLGVEVPADIEGGPTHDEATEINGTPDVVIPAATATTYNKASFFDNISSEAKERDDSTGGKGQRGGVEFRNEERKRNMETFGQGSIDGNFRGRGRGRGRGSGRGYGRGQYNRGSARNDRGGMRNETAQDVTTGA